MRRILIGFATVAVMCAASAPSARASTLLGTQVSGVMYVNGVPINYFDPTNGYVPSGYGNSSSPNNVVIGAGVEFGYQDNANTDTADFSDAQLTLTDFSPGGSSLPITYTFTDAAFTGLLVTLVSDSFPNGGIAWSLVNDVLTIDTPSFNVAPATFQAVFDFAPVATTPLPAALPLFATGLGMLGLLGWRRKRKQIAA